MTCKCDGDSMLVGMLALLLLRAVVVQVVKGRFHHEGPLGV